MKDFKSHFVFNKSERNGIFVLVLIIMILQGTYFLVDFSSDIEIPLEKQEEIVRFQSRIDSLKRVAAAEDTMKIYPFNPNFITDFRGYSLGMSVEEIDRLHAFRASDNWINSTEQFQEVTGVSDSLLAKISPHFKFPSWAQKNEVTNALGETTIPGKQTLSSSKSNAGDLPVRDLNEATAEALKEVYGVGEVLSKRIIKYRESIGGFRDEIQLYDVYGLAPEVVERIRKSFKIMNSDEVSKKDLNNISVLDLSEIPGISYQLAREIIEYRDRNNGFVSFEELGKIKGFPLEKINRIQLYLTIKQETIPEQDSQRN